MDLTNKDEIRLDRRVNVGVNCQRLRFGRNNLPALFMNQLDNILGSA